MLGPQGTGVKWELKHTIQNQPSPPSTPTQTSGEILAEGKLACTGLKQAEGEGVSVPLCSSESAKNKNKKTTGINQGSGRQHTTAS